MEWLFLYCSIETNPAIRLRVVLFSELASSAVSYMQTILVNVSVIAM